MVRKILRRRQVEEATGLSKSAIYQNIADGRFPKPVPITDKAVGWLADEVEAWQADRVALRDAKAA